MASTAAGVPCCSGCCSCCSSSWCIAWMSNWGAQIHKSHKRKTSNLEKSRSRNQSRLPIRMVVTPSKKNLFQSRLQWRWLWEWSSTLYDGDLHSMTQEDHSSKTRTSWDDIMIPVVVFLSWLTIEKSMEIAILLSRGCVNFHAILLLGICIHTYIYIL